MPKLTLSFLLLISLGKLQAQNSLLEQLRLTPADNAQQAAIIAKLHLKEERIYQQASSSEPRFLYKINRFDANGQTVQSITFSTERDTIDAVTFIRDANQRLTQIKTTEFFDGQAMKSLSTFTYNDEGKLTKKEFLGHDFAPTYSALLVYNKDTKRLANVNTIYIDSQMSIDSIKHSGDTLSTVVNYLFNKKGQLNPTGAHQIFKFDSAQQLYALDALNYNKPVYKLRQVFEDNRLNEFVEKIYDPENDLFVARAIRSTLSYDKRGLLIQLINSQGLVESHEYK